MKQLFRILFFSALAFCPSLNAQVVNTATLDTTGGQQIGNTSIGAYLDLYYGYNTNQPAGANIPYFVTSSRHNEFSINLAYIDIRYQSENTRVRIVPGFGTYVNANYVNEPGSLKNLIEANAGIRLSKKKKIWLDVGILGSPYTNESAISKDHLMYTRSLAPEYVPYYLSGAKLSVPLNKKLNAFLYILNGWQQIQDNNNGNSVGTQLEYRPNEKHLFNWDTYVGDERSIYNPFNRVRYFTDIYWLYNAGKKWSFTSCIYVGRQDQKTNQNVRSSHYWWQANFIASYAFTSKFFLSGRLEYFADPDQMIIKVIGPKGFEGGSAGLNLNYRITEKSLFRLEGRHFFTTENQFVNHANTLTNQMSWLIGNITIWF
ncbi:MAG: porin [Bacteroidetes bacterium]|nr:porin [Bacteroidota bacterium]